MNINSPNWIQWLSLVLVILIGLGGLLMYSTLGNVSDKADATSAKVDAAVDKVNGIKVPTAAEIAANVVIPQAPAVDTTEIVKVGGSVSKLCWLTADCDGCRLEDSKVKTLSNRKVKQAIEGITGLDTDDYVEFVATVQSNGKYAIAETCAEGTKGNYAMEVIYRIVYTEIDSGILDEDKVIYVSVTANVVDGIDVEDITATQVDRDYEITKKPFA